MQTSTRNTLAAVMAVGMALATPAVVQALPTAGPGPAQASTPHAYCWATRETEGTARRTYYFSRVWSMGWEGPTIGFQPQFQSFVSGRYSSRGGSSAQCIRFFGRQETEQHLNNLAARARHEDNEVVFTNWWPR